MFDYSKIDADTQKTLDTYGFKQVPFEALVERLVRDGLDEDRNRLTCDVTLPTEETLTSLPEPGSESFDRVFEAGRKAIDAGAVGAVILNGGMATRFGGVVKGTVPVLKERSFLDLKLSQVSKVGQGRAKALLMNSFATDVATKTHLKDLDTGCPVHTFCQMISMRLTPEGEVFLGENGKPSLHAPGHGDLSFALRASGALGEFIGQGGKYLTVSNVDNLGASLNPLVIGSHITGGRPCTVELVETYEGDVGGSPALVNGKVAIVETFRLPRSFDKPFSTFNTNTFVFDAQALDADMALDWFAVKKKVEGKTAVQFERLAGQLTELMEVTWLKVPREGTGSRFIPIKNPDDLKNQAEILRAVLGHHGVL